MVAKRISHLFNEKTNITIREETKQKDFSTAIRSSTFSNAKHTSNALLCWLCRGSHKLHQGDTYKKALSRKKIFVEKEGFSWKCQMKDHHIKKCKSEVKCRISYCGKCHHTLLYKSKQSNSSPTKITKSNDIRGIFGSKVYLQILPIKLRNGYKSVITNALLDSDAY